MQFKVGQKWRKRNGDIVTISCIESGQELYPIEVKDEKGRSSSYTSNGAYWHEFHEGHPCELDLVEPVTETISEPNKKFAVGQIWRQRSGHFTTVVSIDADTTYPVHTRNADGRSENYNSDGRYWNRPGASSSFDLVELIADPYNKVSSSLYSTLDTISTELAHARSKFPDSNHCFIALTEEVGELAKALLDEKWERVRKEAVQVAVMAIRIIEEGDASLGAFRYKKGLDAGPTL